MAAKRARCGGCRKTTPVPEQLLEPGERAWHFDCLPDELDVALVSAGEEPASEVDRQRAGEEPASEVDRQRRRTRADYIERSRERNRKRGVKSYRTGGTVAAG